MPNYKPEQLAEWTGGQWLQGRPALVSGFGIDTRHLQKGQLFVALRSLTRDGHDYIPAAAAAGAAGAIVSRPDLQVQIPQLQVEDPLSALQAAGAGQRSLFSKPVVAISGSCGKTSTKELLALLLGGGTLKTEGNLNNHIGLPLTLLRLDADEQDAAVVEIGISLRGEMAVLARVAAPDVAIITNVGPAHLSGLGSMDGVAAEKALLPASLGSDKTAIIPADCLEWEPFRKLAAHTIVVCREGTEVSLPAANYQLAQYRVESVEEGQQALFGETQKHQYLHLHLADGKEIRVPLPRVSPGMRMNAALAIAAASRLGVSAEEMGERIRAWAPGSQRGEVVSNGPRNFYIDCYNANPASMRDAVAAFQERFPSCRRLYVLGCMNELGPTSEALHHATARGIPPGVADRFLLIGREADSLRSGLLEAGAKEQAIETFPDVDAARFAFERLSSDADAVLLKGSRAYGLESLLPESMRQEGSHR